MALHAGNVWPALQRCGVGTFFIMRRLPLSPMEVQTCFRAILGSCVRAFVRSYGGVQAYVRAGRQAKNSFFSPDGLSFSKATGI